MIFWHLFPGLFPAFQNKFLISVELHWKMKGLFILLNDDAETQVNELEVVLLHALRNPSEVFLMLPVVTLHLHPPYDLSITGAPSH